MSNELPPDSKTAMNNRDDFSDLSAEREMRLRTRRSFIVSAVTAAAGYATWHWIKTQPDIDGIPGPLRKVLGWNESASEGIFSPRRRVGELSQKALTRGGPRQNGDIGLEKPVELPTWRLRVQESLELTLDDVKTLPEVSQITPLHCIEGWTTVAMWTGVRFIDFTRKYFARGAEMPFVSLSTPDNDYYVGLDAASAFHPQTLLCYAINSAPLTNAHGAPLRLLIPTKYGIKNLKRIGHIRYTTERPRDYWAEQGYDWYAGF